MTEDSFSPEERALIERLQNAPQSSLTPDRFEAIRASLLDAMDAPPLPAPFPAPVIPAPLVAVAGVLVIVVVTVIVLVSGGTSSTPIPTATLPAPSITPPVATVTPQPSPTATVEAVVEVTPEVTAGATAEATPDPTLPTPYVIVVEGPIDDIQGSVISVYDIDIQLDPDDPLLDGLQIGDIVHVEGTPGESVGVVVIVAVDVTVVNVEINTNPDTGEVWRDDGSCANPPPDWAPAHGWRQRCGVEGGNAAPPGQSGDRGNSGSNPGQGGGNPGQGNDDD